MDTKLILDSLGLDECVLDLNKAKKDIKQGIKQNFKFFKLVNPYFSCKDEDEFKRYLDDLHKLFDETIVMKIAYFLRSRKR